MPIALTVLPDTEPLSVLDAVAVEVLKAFVKLALLVAPLLAADEPMALAAASPVLLFWAELSCVADELSCADGPRPDWVELVLAVCVLSPKTSLATVVPFSCAWTLKPKASAIAAARRVFFIAVPCLKVDLNAGTGLAVRLRG